jgi:hypothetical protein
MSPDLPVATAEVIDKDLIPSLQFAAEDVLSDPAAIKHRRHDAERATSLGNNYQGKLDIYFKTADGAVKRVYTTIWATHQDYLTLKSGITLPIRAIVGFDFY